MQKGRFWRPLSRLHCPRVIAGKTDPIPFHEHRAIKHHRVFRVDQDND